MRKFSQAQEVLHAPNYQVVDNCLAQLQAFRHASMSGEWLVPEIGDPVYLVRSYRKTIAWVRPTGTEILGQGHGLSPTSTRHRNRARRALPVGYRHQTDMGA